jgi:acylphosphatase
MPIARRFLISGRVQRVGFRYFAYERALQEGIGGYVRNLPDDRVEVVAEGEPEAMRRFEMAVRQGPPAARIDSVEVDDVPATGRPAIFNVKGY